MRFEVCVEDVRTWDRRLEGWAVPSGASPASVRVHVRAGVDARVWVDLTGVPTVRAELVVAGRAVRVLPCREQLSGEYEFEYDDEAIVVAILPP